MSLKSCNPEILLNAPTCEIQYCPECEMIHLALGSMTLRIPIEHFTELAKDLGRGAALLQASKERAAHLHQHPLYILHS